MRKEHIHPLKAYREKHGLSTRKLAERIGVSQITVNAYERGFRRIDAERAIKIEKAIGIDREVLRPDLFVRAVA